MFHAPKITFVPQFPSFLDKFPCSHEINDIIPLFPQNPREGLICAEMFSTSLNIQNGGAFHKCVESFKRH